jgi:hypothetical protein
VRGLLGPGSAAGDIRRGMTTGNGIGIGLYVGDSGLGVTGDVGVYGGGGGAGFITTSGKGPPRCFLSEVEEVVDTETVGDVGVAPRGDATRASSTTTVRCGFGCSNVRSWEFADGRGLERGLLRSDSIFWRSADAAPPPRKSKTGLRGERLAVVFEPIGDEDCGDAKPV